MEDIKDTLLKILELQESMDERLDKFEDRLEKLESVSHEQHILSDPELTEAIKKFQELMKKYPSYPIKPYPNTPYRYPYTATTRWTDVKIC